MRDLSKIVKAYDIRGVVPDELDAEVAGAVGAAFAIFTKAPRIVIAHDMRESSVPLSQAVAEGAASQGTDVVMAGLASTDMIYFAAGSLDIPGVMLTASHNPAKYNGIKLCLAGARPVGQETGLAEIRALIENGIPAYSGTRGHDHHARAGRGLRGLPAARSSTSAASGRSRWSSTRATAWAATPCRSC